MRLGKLIGTVLMAAAATGTLYGTADAAPGIDSSSAASGSVQDAGNGTLCNDGTTSPSIGRGTCSHHGGEAESSGHNHSGGRHRR